MAFSQSQIPAYILPGMTAHVTLTAGGVGANYLRVWYTDAPPGSKAKAELLKAAAGRVVAWEGDSGDVFKWTPDVGGRYPIAVQEYTRAGGNSGGGYAHAPENAPLETQVGAEQTGSLVCAQLLEQTIGAGKHTATLVVAVADSTIRPTTLAVHGIDTPAVVSPRSDAALTASLDSGVITAAADMADVAVATAAGSLDTVIADMQATINAHFATAASVHAAADSDNTVADYYAIAELSTQGAQASLSAIAQALDRHMRNDSGSGTGTGAFHVLGGVNIPDWKNLPRFAAAAEDPANTLALAAAIWSAYEAHRVDAAVHIGADAAHVLTALPTLHDTHRQFIAAATASAPTAPSVLNPGAVSLVHGAGMRVRR